MEPNVFEGYFHHRLSFMHAKSEPVFSLARSTDGWIVAFVLIDSCGKVGTLLDDNLSVEEGHVVGRDFGDGFPGVLAKVEAVWFATGGRLRGGRLWSRLRGRELRCGRLRTTRCAILTMRVMARCS